MPVTIATRYLSIFVLKMTVYVPPCLTLKKNKSRLLFSSAEMCKKPLANSVNPDQTAPLGAVCSGSTLFASILNTSVMLGNYFAAEDFSRGHFQIHFFLGPLRVNVEFLFVIIRPTPETDKALSTEEVYLCDSGAQYRYVNF